METIQLIVNEKLLTFRAKADIIKQLNEEDDFLTAYMNKAARQGKLDHVFNDPSTRRNIRVRRVTTSSVPEWNLQRTTILLMLRASDKYDRQFTDNFSFRNQLWEKIASEMKGIFGFEVDGPKCAQRFLDLSRRYYRYKKMVKQGGQISETNSARPECFDDLHKILVNFPINNEIGDENHDETVINSDASRKRKRAAPSVNENERENILEFLSQQFKRKSDEKNLMHRENMCLYKERTNLVKQQVKQNERIIDLLKTLVENSNS